MKHPSDPGGETNFGISKKSYPIVDIENLTKVQAIDIYRADFWDKLKLSHLNPKLRLMAFDCAVNQGPVTAVKILQRCLGIKSDGILGPITISAMTSTDPAVSDIILTDMAVQRHKEYVANSQWPTFGAGWSLRLLNVSIKCLTA